MKTFYLFISFATVLLFTTMTGNAQYVPVNGDYRSNVTTGNWETAGAWQRYNGTAWVAAGNIPPNNANANSIHISNGNTITITANHDPSNVVVDAGGTLVLNSQSGFHTTFVINGTFRHTGGDFYTNNTQIDISGTYNSTGGILHVQNGTTLTIESGGVFNWAGTNGNNYTTNAATNNSVTVKSGGTYVHAINNGTIPTATWQDGSLCKITGYINNALPTGLGQNFYNFTWNCTGQTGNPNTNGALINVRGLLDIESTGSSDLAITYNTNVTAPVTYGALKVGGGRFYFTSGTGQFTNLGIANDVLLTGGNFQPGQTSFNVGGDWTTNTGATFTSINSTVVFNGSAEQTIGGSAATSFNNLTINNSNGITLVDGTNNVNKTVTGTLKLTNGIVHTGSAKVLIIGAGGSVTNASDASFIVGPIRAVRNAGGSFVFPTGKEGVGYIPIGISGVSAAGTYEAELVPQSSGAKGTPGGGLTWVDYCQYWNLKTISPSPDATATVTMYWNEHSSCSGGEYVDDYTKLAVARHPGSGTTWNTTGGTPSGSNISGQIVSALVAATNITATTLFAIGSTMEQPIPLPVKFGDIKGYTKNAGIQVEWTVYSEFNVVRYEIERSSDGVSFSYAGSVAAKNTDGTLYYDWFDAFPLAGNNYYRIKNVDIDGKSAYSSVVKVSLGKSSATGVTVYPNPVTGNHISLQAADLQSGAYKIEIFSTNGQQVYKKQFSHAGGTINQSLELPSALQTGIYNIQLTGNGFKLAKQFLIQ
ncbi:MAG: T9SS type A sorting domain-containing protein [Bacteroidota bacterium]